MKPDVVFCHNIVLWNPNVFKDLKTICSSIKIIVAYVGYPQKSYNYYSNVDLFLGGVPFITEDVLSLGLNAHTMYQSFDKEILKEIDTDNYKNERFLEHDFVFTGSYTWSRLGRYYTLKRLMHDTSLKCWVLENLIDKLFEKPQSFEIFNSGKRILKWFLQYVFQFIKQQKQLQILEIFNNEPRWLIKKKLYSIFSIVLQAKGIHIIEEYEKLKLCLPISDLFPGRVFPPVYGFDMYRLIQGSRITFNVHTKQAREFVGNMRLFEATGMGTCLLTDTGVNMCEIFEEDNEVVTYRSVDEAIEKANYLLNHEDERKKIALAGQKRTLKDHTAFNRAQQLDQLLRESI